MRYTYNKLELIEKIDPRYKPVSDELIALTAKLLELYKFVIRKCQNDYDELQRMAYARTRKSLSETLDMLTGFSTDRDSMKYTDKLCSMHIALNCSYILETTLVYMKEHDTQDGRLFQLLRYLYFDDACNTVDDICCYCNLSRRSYFRLRRQAIDCYARLLWNMVLKKKKEQCADEFADVNILFEDMAITG